MRNKLALVILALLLVTTSACDSSAERSAGSTMGKPDSKPTANEYNETLNKNTYGVKINNETYDITKLVFSQNEHIDFIHNLDKDRLFIAADNRDSNEPNKKFTVKIFNINKGNIEKQISFEKASPLYRFMPLAKGFYVIEETAFSNDKEVIYHLYDSDLNPKGKIDLTQIVRNTHLYPAVSNDMSMLAYVETTSKTAIYTCDLNLNNKKKIYETEQNHLNQLSFFPNLSFVKGDKKIAFVGNTYISNDIQPTALGVVNIDGGEVTYKEHDGLNNNIQEITGKTFFYDAFADRGKQSSGKVFLLDNTQNTLNEFGLQDCNESQRAVISDEGNFIVTILAGKPQNGQSIYRFRTYDIKTGRIIKEFDFTFESKDSGIFDFIANESGNGIYAVCRVDSEMKLYKYALR